MHCFTLIKILEKEILECMGSKVINNFFLRNDFLIYEAVREFSCVYEEVIYHIFQIWLCSRILPNYLLFVILITVVHWGPTPWCRPKFWTYTVKKVSVFPSPAGMSRTKLSFAGDIKLFPARESLVSDIRLGTGKLLAFFTAYLAAGRRSKT